MKRASNTAAHGKLLLTGEYLVMLGATALAMPVKFGQRMAVRRDSDTMLRWTSVVRGKVWFTARFDPDGFRVAEASDQQVARRLRKLLLAAQKQNTSFSGETAGCHVTILADYPLEWGLGSSSTLLFLVARWAGADPFTLHHAVSDGSGYDVACAGSKGPIFYTLTGRIPVIEPAVTGGALRRSTRFVFLGRKQDSAAEISAFRAAGKCTAGDLETVSRLSWEISRTESADELVRMVGEHNSILAAILKREPLGSRLPAFPGAAKYLGAWGGDFAMFASTLEPAALDRHIRRMGFTRIFTYDNLEAKA